MKINPS